MKRLFTLAAAALLFSTGIVGCQNTANGAAEDASKDSAAVQQAAVKAADKTVEGTQKAVAATEKGAADAAAATEKAAANTAAAVEKGAANAAATTEKAAADVAASTKEAADKAAMGVKHTGKILTITPTVKAALLRDNTLFPSDNASMNSINVDTESDGQTIKLSGTVKTADMKKHAEAVAKDALKDHKTEYKIDNQLTVGSK